MKNGRFVESVDNLTDRYNAIMREENLDDLGLAKVFLCVTVAELNAFRKVVHAVDNLRKK